MSRILPKPDDINLPSSERFIPGTKVFSGEDVAGCVREVVGIQNLGHATGFAGPLVQQCWADGQFSPSTGAVKTLQCRWKIPTPAEAFDTVKVSVYAKSATTTGVVTFDSITAASLSIVNVNNAAFAWFDGTLTVDTGASTEEITLSTTQDVEIVTVLIQYPDVQDGSAWPTNDGELEAGKSGYYTPLDTREVDDDHPLSADLGQLMTDNINALSARDRVYLNFSGLDPNGLDKPMETYPHRTIVPVKRGGTELDVYIYAEGFTLDYNLYIKHGPGDARSLYQANVNDNEPPNITILTIAGQPVPAPAWYTTTVTLREGLDADAPGRYPGFVSLEILPQNIVVLGVSYPRVKIYSATIIGE